MGAPRVIKQPNLLSSFYNVSYSAREKENIFLLCHERRKVRNKDKVIVLNGRVKRETELDCRRIFSRRARWFFRVVFLVALDVMVASSFCS